MTFEEPKYLNSQILTYIGNKRALLSGIGSGLELVKSALGKEKLRCFDVFSGSGIVSRFFKQYSSFIYANDLEPYSAVINECYLANKSSVDTELWQETLHGLEARIQKEFRGGFIREMYAPKDDNAVAAGERVFYTVRNAMYIDTARQEIGRLPREMQKFFLGPLLYEASVHTNTGGVFKGFYKNKEGVGQYGGAGRNALFRILGEIKLQLPVLSNFECEYQVMRQDALKAAEMAEPVDVAYLDPPYNQHPYGSNYFMLNLILDYKRPRDYSKVSGIPAGWNHSNYNRKAFARNELFRLVQSVKAKYVMISYNSEGFVKYEEFVEFLSSLGKLSVFETKYITFKASRNLNNRDIHVTEYLFLLEKG